MKSPGTYLLEEVIKPLNLSIPALAKQLQIPPNRLYLIISGDRELTTDTALRLAHYFDTPPEFWLNLQLIHNLEKATAQAKKINKTLPTYEKSSTINT